MPEIVVSLTKSLVERLETESKRLKTTKNDIVGVIIMLALEQS